MQKDEKSSFMRLIYFAIRIMIGAEKGCISSERMVLALMFALTNFWSYLLPRKFIILTLEETFPTLLQHMDESPWIAIWLLKLQEFEYTIQVESSTQASLVGLLTHCPFEKKMKISTPTPPPPVEAKKQPTLFSLMVPIRGSLIEKQRVWWYTTPSATRSTCMGKFWSPHTPIMRLNTRP